MHSNAIEHELKNTILQKLKYHAWIFASPIFVINFKLPDFLFSIQMQLIEEFFLLEHALQFIMYMPCSSF